MRPAAPRSGLVLVALLALGPLAGAGTGPTAPSPWATLEPGLELGEFLAPVQRRSPVGDSTVRVLRVDPAYFDLVLVNASAGDKVPRTAKDFAAEGKLVAAINSSMFGTDRLSSPGRMHSASHVNQARWSADKAMLVFDPVADGLPRVRILDRECDDWDAVAPTYRAGVQSIRMLSCKGTNVWKQQPRSWSHAVIGIDGAGRPLLIQARSPWTTHDFVELLRALPLDLRQLQYAEGGPEVQLYVHSGSYEREWVGSFETGFREDDRNNAAWAIPNVVGVRRREASSGAPSSGVGR